MDTFAEKLDLWQTDFFNLALIKNDNTGNFLLFFLIFSLKDFWLNPQKTIEEEKINPLESNIILKIKIWKTPKKLIDPAAIHLFYLQVTIIFFFPKI